MDLVGSQLCMAVNYNVSGIEVEPLDSKVSFVTSAAPDGRAT
jgi:hypothetical protein